MDFGQTSPVGRPSGMQSPTVQETASPRTSSRKSNRSNKKNKSKKKNYGEKHESSASGGIRVAPMDKRPSDNELQQIADIPLQDSSGGQQVRNNEVIMQEFVEELKEEVSEENKRSPSPKHDFLPPISPSRGNIMA